MGDARDTAKKKKADEKKASSQPAIEATSICFGTCAEPMQILPTSHVLKYGGSCSMDSGVGLTSSIKANTLNPSLAAWNTKPGCGTTALRVPNSLH